MIRIPLSARLAWRNLWRHSRRTLLTITAIAFGVALVIVSMGLREGGYTALVDQAVRVVTGHVQVQARTYVDEPILRHDLPDARAWAQRLRERLPESAVSTRALGFALLASERQTLAATVAGVEVAHEAAVSAIPDSVRAGRYLAEPMAMEVVLGEKLAHNLEATVGDILTLLGTDREGSVAATLLTVVGIFRSGVPELDRQLAQMPLGAFQQVFALGEGAHALVVRAEGDVDPAMLRQRVGASLGGDPAEVAVLTWDELQPGTREAIELDFAASLIFYMALIAIITIGILNTFIMSVLERTREFGAMLALGVAPGRLMRVVLTENIMLLLLSVACGVVLGALLSAYLLAYGFEIPGMAEFARAFGMPARLYPVITAQTLLTGPALVFGIAVIVSSLPVLRIRRLVPVQAMRAF
ncbi:MAG: ABC transporter permease [Gammaproteobacteria bacterium]